MNQFVLIHFRSTGRDPQVIGPFDSEFAATHYHDTNYTQNDCVLLLPMAAPKKEAA